MEATKWRYYDSNDTPSVERLKKMLYSLVRDVREGYSLGGGGFDVKVKDNTYNIKFTIGHFNFNKKSEDWDEFYLGDLNALIGRVEDSENIINSLLGIFKKDEKELFFKKECDLFMDSGSDYYYNKKLGLLFTKEDFEDEGFICVLDYIGVDKDYII
jgi:hypothetical protein